jgi:hypothetical protein
MSNTQKDLTDQAVEVLEDKVLNPLKKKMFPYLCGAVVFNVLLLVILVVILLRLPSTRLDV